MIILKVTKNQGFTLPLEDTFFEKLQGGQIDTAPRPSPAVLRLKNLLNFQVSSRKSRNLQFDWLLLSKAYKDLDGYRRVMSYDTEDTAQKMKKFSI